MKLTKRSHCRHIIRPVIISWFIFVYRFLSCSQVRRINKMQKAIAQLLVEFERTSLLGSSAVGYYCHNYSNNRAVSQVTCESRSTGHAMIVAWRSEARCASDAMTSPNLWQHFLERCLLWEISTVVLKCGRGGTVHVSGSKTAQTTTLPRLQACGHVSCRQVSDKREEVTAETEEGRGGNTLIQSRRRRQYGAVAML